MKLLIGCVLVFIVLMVVLVIVYGDDVDSDVIELSEEQAEELRKQLNDRQDKDINLDKEE